MITRDEHVQWCKEHIDPLGEDGEKASAAAEVRYTELTVGMTVTIVTHDWKETGDHMREVCEKVKELNASNMHFFNAFHEFTNGSLDSIVTVISDEELTEEFAEVLVDLVVNLGAEGT